MWSLEITTIWVKLPVSKTWAWTFLCCFRPWLLQKPSKLGGSRFRYWWELHLWRLCSCKGRSSAIMAPPAYLPSTHRLLLTLRRCEKQQRNWRASKPLQGFPTNKPITNTHFIIISLSVVLVESSYSPIIFALSHWQPSLFCGLIPLPYMVLRIQQYDRILPCFSFLGAAFLAHKVTGKWTALKTMYQGLQDQGGKKWYKTLIALSMDGLLHRMWIFSGKSFCKSWEPTDVPPRLPRQIVAGDGHSQWFTFGPVDSLNITHPLIANRPWSRIS